MTPMSSTPWCVYPGCVGESTADGDDAHRVPVLADVVAYLLEAAQRREIRDRIGEHRLADVGEPGGHTDHVLLGDADVDELSRQCVSVSTPAPRTRGPR